ncbi:RIB43A-like with coiled-coils protein 2 [Tubulanus polymorphus]|uniref:RIB43A-like with coiled-coils protein 2 n=1 Tax=Tubulanus polymorphus TaxID=672921 RepID=UPI003DA62AFB
MYKLDLPIDHKEYAAIERRRNMEAQRQSRIFNARVRTIGVDLDAIGQQVADKQQMEDYEKRREEAFAADAVRYDKIAMLLQKRQEHDIRELNQALNEFRALHQQNDSRREWDMNDPDALKKDKPARVTDDDPRCGISGMQKFEGEDLNNKARNKFISEQRRAWSEAQTKEKMEAEQAQKKAERLHELKMRELDQRAMQLKDAEDKCRRAINFATTDFNAALAREAAEKERLHKQQEEDDNATEISNSIFGDLLTENPGQAQSAFGAHRVIPDRWKGMSPQQIEDIKKIQEDQMKEKERLRQEEELRNKEWERQQMVNARAGILMEREQDRTLKELQKQLADENQRLAAEQKANLDYMDKEVYTNQPSAAYFMQFNKTSR